MRLFGFFDQRVRGFRVVELGGAAVLLVLVLVVYLAKSGASGKGADIDRLAVEIADEQAQIRLLGAEVAHEESPERLAALSSRYLGLAPTSPKQEAPVERLAALAAPLNAAPVTAAPLAAAPPAASSASAVQAADPPGAAVGGAR